MRRRQMKRNPGEDSQLLRLSDDPIADEDLNLALVGLPRHGFQPGFFRGLCVDPFHIRLQPTHQKQQAQDRERPHRQHDEEDDLVLGHERQCRRA